MMQGGVIVIININPCYDMLKRADCPNRKEGCAANCEKWREYKSEKEEDYRQRVLRCNGKPKDTHHKNGKDKRR